MDKKKKLLEMIARKEARKAELIEKAKTSTDVVELRSINTEIETLNTDMADIRATIVVIETDDGDDDEGKCPACGADADDGDEFCSACGSPLDANRSARLPNGTQKRIVVPTAGGIIVPNGRGAAPAPLGAFKPLGTYQQMGHTQRGVTTGDKDLADMTTEELLGTPVYRMAFLKNLQRKPLDQDEQRAVAIEAERRAVTTGAGEAGAAVPTTTYDKVIMKLRQYSVLFPLISDTYIPGNVNLPVANVLNAAVWSAEATGGATGDDTVVACQLFGFTLAKYTTLSIAVTMMAVDAFEAYIVNQLGIQLSIAIENAILNGLGPTPAGPALPQPTGILTGLAFPWTSANSLNFSLANGIGYDDFVNAQALMYSLYREGAVFVMNRNMEAAVYKIKSSTGVPLFSQDPQNGFVKKILNYLYVVDDYMPDNDVLFARMDYFYFNFSQSPIIEADRSVAFSSASIMYRGLLIGDGKPALGEAFINMTGV